MSSDHQMLDLKFDHRATCPSAPQAASCSVFRIVYDPVNGISSSHPANIII